MTKPLPDLPPPPALALLLDFDGTLVDIAPTPDAVRVEPGLVENLRRLQSVCGGALAIVTGRPIGQLDKLLGVAFAAAGEHGAAFRLAPGAPVTHAEVPDAPAHWVMEAQAVTARFPGASIEPKRHGFVVHYRAVPEAGPPLRDALEKLVAEWPEGFALAAAKMAWELRPLAISKATAVRELMRHPPFAGRVPVFVGDDITDEDGMAEAHAMGGLGFRVPDDFADAAAVRAWIARLAQAEPGAAFWPA